VKLTNPLATGNFAVSASLSYAMLSRSLCPGVRTLRASSVTGSGMRCLGALLVQGEEGVVTKGGIVIKDLGRMQIVFGGQLSEANSTNFAVCRVTVPLVLACFGWDGVTVTLHPMGKLVGNAKFVTVVGEGAC
jgi:hypothetical protein